MQLSAGSLAPTQPEVDCVSLDLPAMSSRSLPVLAPRAPGSAPEVAERAMSREHTEAEWKSMRGVIEQLYIHENRKLVETMAILESKYGFAAT